MVGNVVQVIVRIEIVILRRDVNIVHVEKNSAVGQFCDFAEKFPFGHFGSVKLRITAHVLHADRHFEKIARFADVGGGGARRANVYGIGKRSCV